MVNSNNATQIGFPAVKNSYGGGQLNNAQLDQSYQQVMNNSRRIGPFSFDIDDEIDTEILTSEEVYKDLKELETILDKGNDRITVTTRSIGRVKKKANKRGF